MKQGYIKGLRNEIVSIDSIDRFWKVLDEKTGNWEVWVDAGNNSTELFEGSESEVKAFVAALDDLFEPYDLTNEADRERLKNNRGSIRITVEPDIAE